MNITGGRREIARGRWIIARRCGNSSRRGETERSKAGEDMSGEEDTRGGKACGRLFDLQR